VGLGPQHDAGPTDEFADAALSEPRVCTAFICQHLKMRRRSR
jgi:hypothetical protein